METSRIRIRRDFAPLTVSVAIACDTGFSPLLQVYDAESGEYEPNRLLSPTVIRPLVNANAVDGSWPDHNANSQLANLKWYVNGVELSQAGWQERSGPSGDYSIEYNGASRGSLTIYRNISPGTQFSFRFEAQLVDNRLGVLIPIRTDEVVLSTVDKALDAYSLSIGEDTNIRYSPFLDKLHLYDYKISHGIAASDADAKDGNEYLRTIPISLYKGEKLLEDGYTIKLYRVNDVNSLTLISSTDYEVISVNPSAITLDLRLIEKDDFAILAFIDDEEVARIQCSVQRIYPSFRCQPSNETGIIPGQLERYDEAKVTSEGRIIEYPGSILRIVWKTTTAAISNMEHNEGGITVFDIQKTGIGSDHTDDWIDVATEAVQKPAYCVATDESGNTLTDENGNILIFN